MHGVFKDGKWIPEDNTLQAKGITVEDIVRDHELSGGSVDVIFICSNENNSRVRVIPFQREYGRPKVYMKNKPAQGKVAIDSKAGGISVQMRVGLEDDVEFQEWKNWGRVKVA